MTDEALITLFGIPKAFAGGVRAAQTNTLQSWSRLPDTRVIIFGDEAGVGEETRRLGLEHEPQLDRTDYGTPLVGQAFERVARLTNSPLLAYANFDILLFPDFVEAARAIRLDEFLAVGQRWNMDVPDLIDFDEVSGEALQMTALQAGALEPPWGSDVFVWSREIEWQMPPFAVGRPPWDNWLIHRARTRRIPVVDITPSTVMIHQNHDYSHIPDRGGPAWSGPETSRNWTLVEPHQIMDLTNATHLVVDGHLKRARGWRYLRSRILRLPLRYPQVSGPYGVLRKVFRVVKKLFRSREEVGDPKSYR